MGNKMQARRRAHCARQDVFYLWPRSSTALLLWDPDWCRRFIYHPLSPSSSKFQVSKGSLPWLFKGLLASSLTVKFPQVTVTDHRRVSSQQALKNVCAQRRIMLMRWERQKVGPSSMEPQTKPTYYTSTARWLPSNHWAFSWHHPYSEHDKSPLFTSTHPFPTLHLLHWLQKDQNRTIELSVPTIWWPFLNAIHPCCPIWALQRHVGQESSTPKY